MLHFTTQTTLEQCLPALLLASALPVASASTYSNAKALNIAESLQHTNTNTHKSETSMALFVRVVVCVE